MTGKDVVVPLGHTVESPIAFYHAAGPSVHGPFVVNDTGGHIASLANKIFLSKLIVVPRELAD